MATTANTPKPITNQKRCPLPIELSQWAKAAATARAITDSIALTSLGIGSSAAVIPGLVPGIHQPAGAAASGTMDPGDKPRDDISIIPQRLGGGEIGPLRRPAQP